MNAVARRRSSDSVFGKLAAFWDFVDNRGIIRRVILGVAIYMTWRVSVWSMGYAEQSAEDGVQIAAILVAVQAPVTLFAGMVFKAYIEGRAG